MFIVLEGLDASGKSTQAAMIAAKTGAILFKFPDRTTPLGGVIDRWLKGKVTLCERVNADAAWGESPDAPLALQGFLLANKVEAQARLHKALCKGWVVADRYAPSAVAYGTADGLDEAWLTQAHGMLLQPDLNILLDITVDEAKRRRSDGEHYEQDAARLARARQKYREIARGRYWVIIDGAQPPEHVTEDIMLAIGRHNAGK